MLHTNDLFRNGGPEHVRNSPYQCQKRPRSQIEDETFSQETSHRDPCEGSDLQTSVEEECTVPMRPTGYTSLQSPAPSSVHGGAWTESLGSSTSMETIDGSVIHSRKKSKKMTISSPDIKLQTTFDDAQAGNQFISRNSPIEIKQAPGEDSKKRKGRQVPKNKTQSAYSDAEGKLGWGWRARGEKEKGPTFGETVEIQPLFDARGNPVKVKLHGSFEFSRNQRGKVSDDGGPLVHELQKRNLFHIKDMAYTLDMAGWVSTYPTLRVNDGLQQIHGMFIKLIGRSCGSKVGVDAPLETRGKAREKRTAEPVHLIKELLPQRSDGPSKRLESPSHEYEGSLPDVCSATHLEFKHATAGNKTMGYWRLDTQDFYRIVIQLCANIGDPKDLLVVAESETDRLLVRGRPPGGREQAKANAGTAHTKEMEKPKKKGSRPDLEEMQKRRQMVKHRGEETDWTDNPLPTPLAQGFDVQAAGEKAPHSPRWAVEGKAAARRYNTRNVSKHISNEKEADSSDNGSNSFGDENENEDRDRDHEESSEEESEAPLETEAQQSPGDNVLQEQGNYGQHQIDEEGYQHSDDASQPVSGKRSLHDHEKECARWSAATFSYGPEGSHGEAFNPDRARHWSDNALHPESSNWLSTLPSSDSGVYALPPSIGYDPFPTDPAGQPSGNLFTQGQLPDISQPPDTPEATILSNSNSDQSHFASEEGSLVPDHAQPPGINSIFLSASLFDEDYGEFEELSRHFDSDSKELLRH